MFEGRRVLVVSSSYPYFPGDFRALFVHEMARAMVREGARVRVVTPVTPEGVEGASVYQGVEIDRFRYPGFGRWPITGDPGLPVLLSSHPARWGVVPGYLAAFLKEARRQARFEPDLVVSHWLIPGGLVGARLGVPHVQVAHSSDVRWLGKAPQSLVRTVAASGPILATSELMAERLAALGVDSRVWRMGVDVERMELPRERLTIGTMGRLVETKGLDVVLEAGELLGAQVRIAGDGPAREDAPEFVGPVLGGEKSRFLSGLDAFVFTPRPGPVEDNLPVAVLEAMAAGVPVFATPVGALPGFFEAHGGGVLVEPTGASVAEAVGRGGVRPCEIDLSWGASMAELGRML